MSDLIEITDEERELRRGLNALRLEASGSIVDHLTGLVDAALATRKPAGDGEVVLRLTREEAKWAAARLEPHSDNEHERAASRKLRAALDQGNSDPAPAGREENA